MAVTGGWKGALGGFLFGGVARVVAVQHCTFFINSACHTFGNQPYSDKLQRAGQRADGVLHLRRGLP